MICSFKTQQINLKTQYGLHLHISFNKTMNKLVLKNKLTKTKILLMYINISHIRELAKSSLMEI